MSESSTRLARLRREIAASNVAGFIVPRADEHLSEYVPMSSQRLTWLTGFSGSAGIAAILPDHAAVFTDGRYQLQIMSQVDGTVYERLHMVDQPPARWLAAHAPGARIGYDPRLISEDGLAPYDRAGLTMVPLDDNPVDRIWVDRPAPPSEPVRPHDLAYAGVASEEKRKALAVALAEAGHDAAVLTDPASVAWLLNVRGDDVGYTPFALAFALLHADASVDMFLDRARLQTNALDDGVRLHSPAALTAALRALDGQRVRVDANTAPAWFAQTLRDTGAIVITGDDPAALPKARKNHVEQQGARAAHRRDAVALCRFLHWLDTVPPGSQTEISAAAQLVAFRAELPLFQGESFPAISGAGPNGAIIHYRVTPETNRVLAADEPYLIDSGAQFLDGTTDVTRTVWIGPGQPPAGLRDRVTRVMAGHLALTATRFPHGTTGPHLDAIARRPLWQAGLDYDHGTGHGVGSFLSVHEGPVSISRLGRPVPIEAGMILSNEPGFYLPGHYGIRMENLLMVQPVEPAGTRPFLRFEVLTLAPFDQRLIDRAALPADLLALLDAYHRRVWEEIGPDLPDATRDWLRCTLGAVFSDL